MRSRRAGFRAGLLVASALIPLHAAAFADQYVGPGDTGHIRVAIENLKESKYPVEGAAILVSADARFTVDAGESVLAAPIINPGEKKQFSVYYVIRPDAAEGPFPVVVTPTVKTFGLQPGLETAVTTLNFIVDATLPGADVYDDQGLNITNSTTTRTSVVVRATDPAPGSGIYKFSIAPGSYEDVIVDGGNAAGVEASQAYSGLPDGSYTVKIEDVAGNVRQVAFNVDTVPPAISLYDSRGLLPKPGATKGADMLFSVDDRHGQDFRPATVVSGIDRIEVFTDPATPANRIGFNEDDFEENHTYTLAELGVSQLPEGLIHVKFADKAGNIATKSFTVDRVVPTVTLATNEDIPIVSGGLTESAFISATAMDASSGIDEIGIYNSAGGPAVRGPIYQNGEPEIKASFPDLVDNNEGEHYIARVVDRAGNQAEFPFRVRHAPLVELTFNATYEYDYTFSYYGASVQTFSIPYAAARFFLRDPAGVSSFVLKRGGVAVVSRNYPPGTITENESLDLEDGTYEFTVGSARGQTTSGTFTRHTIGLNLGLARPQAGASLTGDEFHVNFPITCSNTGPAGTSLSALTIRRIAIEGAGEEAQHVFKETVANLACGETFDGHLDNGLYAVVGLVNGYEIIRFFRVDTQPVAMQTSFQHGAFNGFHTTLEGFNLRLSTTGVLVKLNPDPEDESMVELVEASGSADSRAIHLFTSSDTLLVPYGAIGVALTASPTPNALNFSAIQGGYTEAAGDTGLSQTFALSVDGGAFASIARWKLHLAGLLTDCGEGCTYREFDYQLDQNPTAMRLLGSTIAVRQTLTHNTAVFRGNPPGSVTPFGSFSPLSFMYVMTSTVAIEDMPLDTAAGLPLIAGAPAFQISTSRPGVIVLLGDGNEPSIRGRIAELASRGFKLAGGDIALVDPPVIQFNSPAVATMRFAPAAVAASGIDINDLALYQAEPGGNFYRVANQVLSVSGGFISAPVLTLSEASLFGIFGPAAAPSAPIADTFPPRTALTATESVFSGPTLTVSSRSALGFSAPDDKSAAGDGQGVGIARTFYAIDGGGYAVAPSSFALVAEGTHTFTFYSVDLYGNAEQTKSASAGLDLTPPAGVVVSSRALFAVNSVDPVVNGAAAGVDSIRYLIDFANPEVCNSAVYNPAAEPGTCENQVYGGPFSLSNGPHTIALRLTDKVGNDGGWQFQQLEVVPQSENGGLGIGRDAFDAFWSVLFGRDSFGEDVLGFARADSFGVLLSSAALADGISGLPWSVFFGPDERAYAVGAAGGPATQALDLAVYKAAPEGGAIESRTLFDSGYANNDLIFDAKAPGWIVGAAQTSGPIDLDVEGDREFSLALWRFDSALGTVQLKTTYARAGFDLGTGLAVDVDGSLWVAGYSLSPEAPAVGAFDLALWHFAANGQTLLGGPFLRPGYGNDIGGGLTARVFVSSQAVYVAAPRAGVGESVDMAFLRYDKATGQPTSESAWRSADGAPSYPVAILPDAAGILVAGGIGDAFTEAALWRFGHDGSLQSATTAGAGGARGAVFRGSELWLAVDGSSAPHRVQAESFAAGALIDLLPPRTALTAGEPSIVGGTAAYVTGATPLGFTVVDDRAVVGDGLGVGATQTFYATDGAAYAAFTGSFTLVAEGTHTISFYSIDFGGRVEGARTQIVAVDLTGPDVTLTSSGTVFTLAAVDPVVGGAASGVDAIHYIVDQDPGCEGVEESTAAAPGTCENPFYTGPFELSIGTHTIFFVAADRLGNGEEVTYSSFVTVGQPALTSIAVTPTTAFVAAGLTAQFEAAGTFTDGSTRTLTGEVVWSTDVSSVAMLNTTGLATGIGEGMALVIASSGTITGQAILTVAPPILVSIAVTPPSASIAAGLTAQFESAGIFTDGSTRTLSNEVAWTTDASSVATVSASGLATGVGEGTALVIASSGTIAAQAVLTVTPPALVTIAVTPPSATIAAGLTAQFEAAGTFTDGSTRTLTGDVAWSTDASSVATVSASGLATAVGEGTALVIASSGTITAQAILTVTPPILVSIAVTPLSAAIAAGLTAQFEATGSFTDASTRILTGEVAWSTDASSVATISALGLATGVGEGTAIVIASSGTITAQAVLTVTPPILVSIAVTPVSASILTGQTAQFAAAGTFTDASTRTMTGDVAWSTDVSSVATVSASGLAAGVGPGAARVIASSGTITGFASLTVTAPPLSLASITPSSATTGKTISAALTGTGFDAATALTLERADALRGTWAATGGFALGRYLGTLTKLGDGRVLLAGGVGGPSAADVYDPATGAWTAAPALNQGRDQHAAVALADGRVLVSGGYSGGAPVNSAEIYDPALNTWTAAAPMRSVRAWHQMTSLADGRVLAAGGTDGPGYISSAEIYDPLADTWTPAASMSVGHSGAAMATLSGGKILVAGGFGGNLTGEVYDPATNAWTTATGALQASGYYLQAVRLSNGKVVIAGDPGGTTDLYDPATNALTPAATLGTARYVHAMVGVGGTALVIGGENSTALASTEFYDAAAGVWRPGPSLTAPRTWPRAAVLDDGRVLAAGGFSSVGGTRLNTAELLGAPAVSIAATAESAADAQRLTGTFDLAGAATGYWDVVVRRTDGQSARLDDGFQVLAVPEPTLASITVTPSTASIEAGASAQFAAAGTFTDGSTRTMTGDVAWTTDASSVATVDANGLAAGVGGGTALVAASSGAFSAYATLSVAYVASSTGTVGGSPEVTLVSTAPFSVVLVSTEAGAGAVALGSAAAQGLVLVSPVYEVTREDAGATAILTWSFDPALVDTATLAIWRYDGVEWSSATVLNQIVSVADGVGTVTGEVTLTSLFALFTRGVPDADAEPPLARLDYPDASARGLESALGGVVDVRGAVSDANAVSWTLEAAPGASAAGGFTTIASGAGGLSGPIAAWDTASLSGYQTLRLRAVDASGNAAQTAATVFVGAPVMTFAIGRKDSDAIVSSLKGPTGIAVRSDGAIWVASTQNDQILLISPEGVLLGAAGRAPGRRGEDRKGKKDKDRDDEEEGRGDRIFKTPQGLALDAAGNLYVADRDMNRVVKLSADGQALLLQFGRPGSGSGELRHPFDVAVDANGDVYAADSGNRRVSVFDASGAYLRELGAGTFPSTSEIRGLALTPEGLWVSDKELEVIRLFSRAGALIKTISGADSAAGELSRMRGLASDRLGALYVVEPNRDRVQKFDPRGKGLLAFGTRAGLSHADKKAKRWLTQPVDAAMAPDGSIWVADTGRDRIVRYALPASGGGIASLSTGGGEFASVEPARRVVDHKDGASVSREDGSGVLVPKGALAADLEITVEKGDENVDKEPKEAKRRELKITAVSEEIHYGPEGTTFSAPVTLTIPYDAGLIASRGLSEDDLKVYYWNPTLREWQAMPSTVDKKSKTVNALTDHFSAYQVGALGGIGTAAGDDFGLRDGYAFPNPSRSGSALTFRMQPGSADSIEVRVYDVSGRKVHSSSDFRFRGAFDDGNGKGAQNTYDHVWNVSGIGSGVYTFVMTAKRAGVPDARKSGKVGVIK